MTETVTPLPRTPEYEQHPLSKRYPAYDADQFNGLIYSIGRSGIREPINLFEGKILDGWHRYTAAREAGHEFTPADFITFTGTLEEAKRLVEDKNGHRRHLTTAQKQEFIKTLIKENPTASDRQIAKWAGVNHRTVAATRERMREKVDDQLEAFKHKWEELNQKQRRAFIGAFKEDIRELVRGGEILQPV